MNKSYVLALIILIFSMLFPVCALGETYPVCDCDEKECICFIQLGDEGPIVSSIISLLIEQNYCPATQEVSIFDEGAKEGVLLLQKEYDLPQTGMLDDDTLTLLIWGCFPEELDKLAPSSRYDYNWVPTDGGIRRHRKPDCCEMYDPRKISVRNAEALGYKNCGICNRKDKPIEEP
ncbi:MAG: hypothetical protein IJB69_02195 [Clostridia bacterium]|nr:hypothetical protein [Clostridia bacterium]